MWIPSTILQESLESQGNLNQVLRGLDETGGLSESNRACRSSALRVKILTRVQGEEFLPVFYFLLPSSELYSLQHETESSGSCGWTRLLRVDQAAAGGPG